MLIALQVIDPIPTLPYAWRREDFLFHAQTCAPCAGAMSEQAESAEAFCPEGAAMAQAVGEAIEAQHRLSMWN